MARGSVAIISHWHHLIENFNTSGKEFYEAVAAAVKVREVPEAVFSRVEFKEGGVGSAQREYLRIERCNVVFDICAAPYGHGFFLSSWLAGLKAPNGVPPGAGLSRRPHRVKPRLSSFLIRSSRLSVLSISAPSALVGA